LSALRLPLNSLIPKDSYCSLSKDRMAVLRSYLSNFLSPLGDVAKVVVSATNESCCCFCATACAAVVGTGASTVAAITVSPQMLTSSP
jgi:hypothetical protein